MKKLPFIIIISFFGIIHADDSQIQVIGPFGSLNNVDNPMTLAQDKAQDLLNVDISLGEKSVKKRKGYATNFSLNQTTSPVRGSILFYDSNSNDIVLYFNDTKMYSSVNGQLPTVLMSTGPNGAYWQCVDSQGQAYCNNDSRTGLLKTNGTSFSFITQVTSTGTMIAVTPSRLVTSGFSEAPNRIDFSKASDFTNFIPGILDTDPINFTITAPGSKVTHITYAFNRIMWFKDNSFGYILEGPTQIDWVVKTISPNIGTNDNSSIYWQGILYFRGQDGHIYRFDGSNLTKMTRDIQTTIGSDQHRNQNSWGQSTSDDFNSGSFDNTFYVDTETVPGTFEMTFPDFFNSLRTGIAGTKIVWVSTVSNSFAGLIGSLGTDTNRLAIFVNGTIGGSVGKSYAKTAQPLTNYNPGTTYYARLDSTSGSAIQKFSISFATNDVESGSPFTFDEKSGSFSAIFYTTTAFKTSLAYTNEGSTLNNFVNGSEFSLPVDIFVWLSTNNYTITIGTTTVVSKTYTIGGSTGTIYLGCKCGGFVSGFCYVDTFGITPETATYRSVVHNAPLITTWGNMQINSIAGNGTSNSFIRGSTNPITVNSSTPTWTSIINGNIPSISTFTYLQFRQDLSVSIATATPSLQDFTFNWFEGLQVPAYGIYHRDALWWSVASNASTFNNQILRYDLLNNGWFIYDIPISAPYVRNQSLYFGSPTQGYIYKFGDVDNDNGAAINSYWKSKDFFADTPFRDKDFNTFSVQSTSIIGSSITVTYTIDGSSVNSFVANLSKPNSSFARTNRNFQLGTNGNTMNVQFGNNATNQPFEIMAGQITYRTKSWNIAQ